MTIPRRTFLAATAYALVPLGEARAVAQSAPPDLPISTEPTPGSFYRVQPGDEVQWFQPEGKFWVDLEHGDLQGAYDALVKLIDISRSDGVLALRGGPFGDLRMYDARIAVLVSGGCGVGRIWVQSGYLELRSARVSMIGAGEFARQV